MIEGNIKISRPCPPNLRNANHSFSQLYHDISSEASITLRDRKLAILLAASKMPSQAVAHQDQVALVDVIFWLMSPLPRNIPL